MGAQQQARGQVRQLHKDKAAPLVQHMVVGHGLRRLREAQGLSQKDAAKLLGVSKYTMCRNETGETPCKPEFVLKAGQVYQATSEQLAHLLKILDSANERRWWQGSEWRGVPKEKLHTLATLEEVAQKIRVYDRDRVPGLLQTEDYARAVIRSGMPGASKEEIEKRVQFRLQRQRHFRESQSAHYLCLLDEVSLIRGFGTRETMRGQLNHLIQLDGNPRFGLRLVVVSGMNMPIGLGNTILFDFEEQLLSTVLYEERDGGGLVFQETDEVEHRAKSFDRLLKASLTRPRSKQRLLDRLKAL